MCVILYGFNLSLSVHMQAVHAGRSVRTDALYLPILPIPLSGQRYGVYPYKSPQFKKFKQYNISEILTHFRVDVQF